MTCTCGVDVTETPHGAPVAGGFGNAPPRTRGVLATPPNCNASAQRLGCGAGPPGPGWLGKGVAIE